MTVVRVTLGKRTDGETPGRATSNAGDGAGAV